MVLQSPRESTHLTVSLGIAYKAACILGLDRAHATPTSGAPQPGSSAAVETEIKTRCFWAVWITNCINCQHYTIGTSVNEHIQNLPLPSDDPSPLTSNNDQTQSVRGLSTPAEGLGVPSIMAELVKLMMIWCVLQHSTPEFGLTEAYP